ncbi:unnamed protein product, partial [Coregonus sp. 'balchen']
RKEGGPIIIGCVDRMRGQYCSDASPVCESFRSGASSTVLPMDSVACFYLLIMPGYFTSFMLLSHYSMWISGVKAGERLKSRCLHTETEVKVFAEEKRVTEEVKRSVERRLWGIEEGRQIGAHSTNLKKVVFYEALFIFCLRPLLGSQ